MVFKPNPGPQTSFLAAAEREVLYGGSAGGGKSYAMLADPLRYMYHPQFSGLLLRHTTEELRELIWKSQEIYPKIIPGIKWSERRMQWEAPSGAKLWMSFLDRDEDVMRYQGLSFCVAENTPIALADGTFIPIKDVAVGDKVATLEGSNSVIFKSQKLKKKCVRVDVYSSDGALLSSQIQPYNHPIALLSSKPLKSLSDLSQNVDKLQTSPLQWLSFEQVQFEYQENRDFFALTKDGQSYCKEFVGDNQEDQQLPSLFYPVVLHSPIRQLSEDHVSTQFHTFCKSLQLSKDSNQYLQSSFLDQQQLDGCVQLHKDRNKAEYYQSYNDESDVLLEMQKAVDLKDRYSTYYYQYDEQPLYELKCDLDVAQLQDDVERHTRNDFHSCGRGCTQQYIQYQSSYYAHPYTKEQRHLKVPVELGFVKFVALDDPFCDVYDLTVDECNHYITFGGIVNRNCWVGFDELTQWKTPFAWNYMRSRLRTGAPDLPVYMRATTNPGNAGHSWVKKMFIDPAPFGEAFYATDIETGETLVYPKGHSREGQPLFRRRFIPARLYDNPALASSGDYETMLLSLPENQRRQLLDGNWDTADGAAFPEFNRNIHVVEPYNIPKEWTRFRAADYGYSSHSAVLWFAVAPDNSIVVYRELYVSKVIPEDLAAMVLHAEQGESIRYGVLDSSCWHRRGEGPSIAEKMIMKGCRWRQADRSAGSRVAGKMEIHRRLQIDQFTELPRMVFFNTCTQIIAELPVLPLDKTNPEDINTKVNFDHLYDALRYGLMSRPRSSSIFDYDPAKKYDITVSDPVFGY